MTIILYSCFRLCALLQHYNEALRGLICALLHLKSKEVESVVITNPIELGTSIRNKDFVLDIKIILNDDTMTNLSCCAS